MAMQSAVHKHIESTAIVRMVLTVRFHEPRFAWFSRLGFTSHGSHGSHGSVSRVTVRMVLMLFIGAGTGDTISAGLIITTEVLEVWRLCRRA